MKPPLILVDGSSYLFRAFYALPPLTNAKGFPTGAIRGVISMLRRLPLEYPDSTIIVIFDAKGKTFRDDLDPQYKANRDKAPEELIVQIEPLQELTHLMGFPVLVIPGVEADDVIGTLATSDHFDQPIWILTGDKDMAQLVNDRVMLRDTMKDQITDTHYVKEKYGVNPEQIIDYLALMGDKADNIKGVPSVGPKTAAKWLNQYQTLENIIACSHEIKGKVGEKLRESIEFLPLSKQLATIKCDVDLTSVSLESPTVDKTILLEKFAEYEFKTLIAEFDDNNKTSEANSKITATLSTGPGYHGIYQVILTETELLNWCDAIKRAPYFCFDTETNSTNYLNAELVGISLAIEPGFAAYIPVAHDYLDAPDQLSLRYVLNQLKPILEDHRYKKVGQNLKYDQHILLNYDIQLNGLLGDTMLLSYCLNSTAIRHNMDDMAAKYLNLTTLHFEDVAGKGVKQITFNQVNLDQAVRYGAEDADITLRLYQQLLPELDALTDPNNVYQTIELPLIGVLSTMERTGVLLDCDMLSIQSEELSLRINELEHEVYDCAGETFNLGSTKQLGYILFEKNQLPVVAKTPKGQPSTNEAVLQELAHQHKLPQLILEYRSLTKLKSTYLDTLPKQVNAKTGRIHTSYHQAGTATGRLSSSDPNLQNIPIRSVEGRRIRQAFICPQGYKIIALDYSQIELRIMAHLSQDKGLIKAFKNGLDIHKATASEVFGIPLNEVDSDHRRKAKAINFGLIYGMSAFGLANQLKIPRGQAKAYIDLYFERYPGIKHYMDNVAQLAKQQGFVTTLKGRRLYLPQINSRNGAQRQAAERLAINAPMQGSAADIIKTAMIKTDEFLQSNKYDAKLIMQVHDELVLEVCENDVDTVAQAVSQIMTCAMDLEVELVVDYGVGDNWQQAH